MKSDVGEPKEGKQVNRFPCFSSKRNCKVTESMACCSLLKIYCLYKVYQIVIYVKNARI